MGDAAGTRFELGCCRATRRAGEIVHNSIMRVAVEAALRPTCEPGENFRAAYAWARRGVAQLVAHLLWGQAVGGSNPPSPTDPGDYGPGTARV
jgi:hypothetical protein